MPQWLRITLLLFVVLGILGLIAATFVRAFKKSIDPVRLAVKWIVTLLFASGLFWFARGGGPFGTVYAVLLSVPMAIVLAFIWAPSIGHTLFSPILSALDGGSEEIEAAPLYSTAEGLRRRGKFRESVYAIQEQLQKFPADFTGQMMLAEIQAENLNDLPGAQVTIERFVAQPGHGPKNIAFALNSLADWHLKYNQDLEAARAAVQKIIDLTPDTETAMHAAQRLAHLADGSAMAAVRERKPIPMRSGAMHVGLREESASLRPPEESPEDTAARLVQELETHPLNTEVREKLARLYSEHFHDLDLAVDQLEQLINAPHQPAKEVARWLNTIADLQVKHGASYETICATLQRIIDQFPGVAAEQMALQRIDHVRLEMKANDPGHALKLGTYEKDLGLKLRKPR